MCSAMHLSVVQFSCFGPTWIICRYMFRGVRGLFYWAMEGLLGSLLTGHLEPGSGDFSLVCSDQTAMHFILTLTELFSQQCSDSPMLCSPKLSNILERSVRLGKQGLARLTRCHVLVVGNHARGPNLLQSFLFFGCGVDKCWRSLSAGQPVI